MYISPLLFKIEIRNPTNIGDGLYVSGPKKELEVACIKHETNKISSSQKIWSLNGFILVVKGKKKA